MFTLFEKMSYCLILLLSGWIEKQLLIAEKKAEEEAQATIYHLSNLTTGTAEKRKSNIVLSFAGG